MHAQPRTRGSRACARRAGTLAQGAIMAWQFDDADKQDLAAALSEAAGDGLDDATRIAQALRKAGKDGHSAIPADLMESALGNGGQGLDGPELAAKLADALDPTSTAIDRGRFQPRHKFRRMECSRCGAIWWEQDNRFLHFRYCPHCRARIVAVK